VAYVKEEVLVRCNGRPLARISSGAVEAAPDPQVRPHWQVQFPVADVGTTVLAAERDGGTLMEWRDVQYGSEATLRDPDGALFTVTDVRSPAGADED
jgi:predicted enzyme related to lactoylglutathione lyase